MQMKISKVLTATPDFLLFCTGSSRESEVTISDFAKFNTVQSQNARMRGKRQ